MSDQKNTLTKHGLIVILLWVFAPAAWYLMWKDKRYHAWFPHLLWINGVIFGILTSLNAYKVENHPLLTPISMVVILTFALLQVIGGLYLQKQVSRKKASIHKFIVPIIITFIIDLLLGYLYVIF